jgi:hypothetical protein
MRLIISTAVPTSMLLLFGACSLAYMIVMLLKVSSIRYTWSRADTNLVSDRRSHRTEASVQAAAVHHVLPRNKRLCHHQRLRRDALQLRRDNYRHRQLPTLPLGDILDRCLRRPTQRRSPELPVGGHSGVAASHSSWSLPPHLRHSIQARHLL